jgi:hypothetical protein
VREHAKAVAAAGNEVVVLHTARSSKRCRGLWKKEKELDPELSEGIPAYHVYHRSLPLPRTSYLLYLRSVFRVYCRLHAGRIDIRSLFTLNGTSTKVRRYGISL